MWTLVRPVKLQGPRNTIVINAWPGDGNRYLDLPQGQLPAVPGTSQSGVSPGPAVAATLAYTVPPAASATPAYRQQMLAAWPPGAATTPAYVAPAAAPAFAA